MKTPFKPCALAVRDTGIAMLLAILCSLPVLIPVFSYHLRPALDLESLSTCAAWQLNTSSACSSRAIEALSIGEAMVVDAGLDVPLELMEEDGAAWLEGCFPDGKSCAEFGRKLGQQPGLLGNRIELEWPEFRDRLTATIGEVMNSNALMPVITSVVVLATPFGFIATGFFFLRRRGLKPVAARLSPSRGAIAGVAAALAGFFVINLVETGLTQLGWEQQEQQVITWIIDRGGFALVALFAVAVFIAPFSEELFFRRYLFEFLDRTAGRAWGYVISTALFAFIHFNPSGLVSYVLAGLLLAAVYDHTRSLWAAFVAHGAFNALAFAALLYGQSSLS